MLIATLSYSKLKIIQLPRRKSAAKSDVSSRCFLFCKCWVYWRCYYLHSLQSVFLIKRTWLKWNQI